MNSGELKRAKRDVRRRVLADRDATTPAERAASAAAVRDRCLALPEVSAARTLMVFWTFGSELPTMPLIDALLAAGKVVALPRIVDGDLEARSWDHDEPMSETRFGALEPLEGRRIAPRGVDVVFIPAVAFDRSGVRVGYGGGYYDRFLSTTEATRVGIGLGLQVLDGPLPAGAFDLTVQIIVTEEAVIRP